MGGIGALGIGLVAAGVTACSEALKYECDQRRQRRQRPDDHEAANPESRQGYGV